jgi:hypothetical protein
MKDYGNLILWVKKRLVLKDKVGLYFIFFQSALKVFQTFPF